MNDFKDVELLFVHVLHRMHMQSIDEPLAAEQLYRAHDANQDVLADTFAYTRIIILRFNPTSYVYTACPIFDSVRNVCRAFGNVEHFGDEADLRNFSIVNGEVCIWVRLLCVQQLSDGYRSNSVLVS